MKTWGEGVYPCPESTNNSVINNNTNGNKNDIISKEN